MAWNSNKLDTVYWLHFLVDRNTHITSGKADEKKSIPYGVREQNFHATRKKEK